MMQLFLSLGGAMLLFLGLAMGELFTSSSDMSHLIKTESELIRTMDNYIHAQELRLVKMKKDLGEMERIHNLAAQNPDAFLGNPLNAFLLIKRLTVDWTDMQNTLSDDTLGKDMLRNITEAAGMIRWPDTEDLNGVAVALTRLQSTYQLDTSELASGKIQGSYSAYREFTAGDCFELGRQSYNIADYPHTVLWMNEAWRRLENDDETASKEDVLEYLAFATYKQGNIHHAIKLTEDLLEINQNHSRAKPNLVYYLKEASEDANEADLIQKSLRKGFTVQEVQNPTDPWLIETANYERLCRGQSKLTEETKKNFYCYLKNGPSLYLLIGPVKAEITHINPTLTIFYDVLSDDEIQVIKELATPNFKRATVQNYKTAELETASYRISKSAWLKEHVHPSIATVNKRIAHITGLTMETAEELQVANYGVGGHYAPHFDYARKEEKASFESLGTGNRLATFLFYMSDVEAGGATVFPRIEVSLWPKKGAAAFWFNLHPSGKGDELTRHAACPVLVGQKWVSNKWIHEKDQERNRPCTLREDDP